MLLLCKTAQELSLVSEEQAGVSSNQVDESYELPVEVSPIARGEASSLLKHNQASSSPFA
jgi:hypothetical protein